MNSASVAGVFPEAEHLSVFPHDPVWHVPFPALSNEHPVRPHIRPDHPTGAENTMDWPILRENPPPLKFSPGVIAGHMVSLQLLMMVNIRADSDSFGPYVITKLML